MAHCRDANIRPYFRGDAARADPVLYTFLEEVGYLCAIRLAGNQNLQRGVEHLLTRPIGAPSKATNVFYESSAYQRRLGTETIDVSCF